MKPPIHPSKLLPVVALLSAMTTSRVTSSLDDIPSDPAQHMEEILRSASGRGIELGRAVDVQQIARDGRAFEMIVWEVVDAFESADGVAGSVLYQSIDYALAALLHKGVFSEHSMIRLRADLERLANAENLEILAGSSEIPQSRSFPSDPDWKYNPQLREVGSLVARLGPRISILGARGEMEDMDLLKPFLECGEATIEVFSRHATHLIRTRLRRDEDP